MTSLDFSYDYPSFVSTVFEGDSKVSMAFDREALNLVHVDTRADENDVWRKLRSFTIGTKNEFSLTGSASGQQYRLRCDARPVTCEVEPIKSSGGGGGSDITPGVPIPKDTVNSDSIQDGSIKREDLSEEVLAGLDEMNNIGLTEQDIEDIFFPDGDAPDTGDDDAEGGDDNQNQNAETPENSETPENPETPETPENPETPETPETPESPEEP